MATYVYETIPRQPGELPARFEVIQSMKDAPLTRHPDTGEPVHRIISGGYGLMGVGGKNAPKPQATRGGGGCGCGGVCSCGRG
ncbi:MAG TPA: zinc ribbon domain-containing protein [Opitutaceae bacterium]|nr:zinc ribbon domain-containing protein [Opitutaceae bacterium]